MQGKYIKPNGETVEIAEYDAINKMVCIKTSTGNIWHMENEYSFWTKEGMEAVEAGGEAPAVMVVETPDEPEEIPAEKPKRKYTKKTK